MRLIYYATLFTIIVCWGYIGHYLELGQCLLVSLSAIVLYYAYALTIDGTLDRWHLENELAKLRELHRVQREVFKRSRFTSYDALKRLLEKQSNEVKLLILTKGKP